MRAALLFVLVLALASDARAWESECRPVAEPFGGVATGHDMSICAGTSRPFCDSGVAFARGAQLGEHARIARDALRVAGLASIADESFDLSFYAGAHTVMMGTEGDPTRTTPSEAPARIGRMDRLVTRTTSIASFAQVPDGSHSLGDFLYGNEHCPVAGLPRTPGAGNRACHDFALHMGMINSSHFLPQARDVYTLYHMAAVSLAIRCEDLSGRLAGVTNDLLLADAAAIVQSCEREALAVEAVGQHFLADAFSTGHMWERWGSPEVPPRPDLRYDASVVAIVSGFAHGWRSVIRPRSIPVPEHDRLCLAGPAGGDDVDSVRWRRFGTAATHGGGDLYLLPCSAYGADRAHAVSTGDLYARQRDRMLACMGHGFGDVYDAGPRTRGPRSGTETTLDPLVTGVASNICWESRVTNRSFRNGLDGFVDLVDPSRTARAFVAIGVSRTGAAMVVDPDHADVVDDRLRLDLGAMGVEIVRRAERDPDGIDLASLDAGPMRRLLGYERNSDRAGDVARLAFLEAADPSVWSEAPGAVCTSDADCPSGSVCDPTAPATSGGPSCVRHEASILRAFRLGELPRYCASTTAADLRAARDHCRAFGGERCDACAMVHLPHLRNACDASSYASAEAAGRTELESVCDALRGAGAIATTPVAVYAPYRPRDVAMARVAALALCTEPERETPAASWLPAGAAPPAPGPLGHVSGFANSGYCGPVSGSFWWRGTHDPSPAHTHTYRVYTTEFTDLPDSVPIDRFSLERVAPCAIDGSVVDVGRAFDGDGDMVTDALVYDYTPSTVLSEELCLRVRALDPDAPDVTGLVFLYN